MSEVDIAKWVITILLGVGGYFLKRMIDDNSEKLRDLQSNLTQDRNELIKVKEEYLHKNDFREFKLELRSMFEEIKTDIRGLRGHE